MYWKAKYIIVGRDTPYIFPEIVQHADFARAMRADGNVTGAGFVSVSHEGEYKCYGESVSLRVKSNGAADSKILNKYLGGKQEDY